MIQFKEIMKNLFYTDILLESIQFVRCFKFLTLKKFCFLSQIYPRINGKNKDQITRWEGGSCLGMHVRIKDFKIKKKKRPKQ